MGDYDKGQDQGKPGQDDKPGFGGGTVALEVGDALWVGSYRGDRIAIVPLKAPAGRSSSR